MKKTGLALLLIAAFLVGAQTHRLLSDSAVSTDRPEGRALSADAVERQRILAELEEVHQLRERMLQEGAAPACLFKKPLENYTCRVVHMPSNSVATAA